MQFDAQPTAWAASQGRFFVEFAADGLVAPCAGPTPGQLVMVYEADGGSSVATGATTKCLWPR